MCTCFTFCLFRGFRVGAGGNGGGGGIVDDTALVRCEAEPSHPGLTPSWDGRKGVDVTVDMGDEELGISDMTTETMQ